MTASSLLPVQRRRAIRPARRGAAHRHALSGRPHRSTAPLACARSNISWPKNGMHLPACRRVPRDQRFERRVRRARLLQVGIQAVLEFVEQHLELRRRPSRCRWRASRPRRCAPDRISGGRWPVPWRHPRRGESPSPGEARRTRLPPSASGFRRRGVVVRDPSCCRRASRVVAVDAARPFSRIATSVTVRAIGPAVSCEIGNRDDAAAGSPRPPWASGPRARSPPRGR